MKELRKYIREYIRSIYDRKATDGAQDYPWKHPSDVEHPMGKNNSIRQEIKVQPPKSGDILTITTKGSFPNKSYVILFRNKSIVVPHVGFDKFADYAWFKVTFGIFENPAQESKEVNFNANMFEEYLRTHNLKYEKKDRSNPRVGPTYTFLVWFDQPSYDNFKVYYDNELITTNEIS